MQTIDRLLNQITSKRLMVVFPHPDDESVMAGGLIQRASRLGFQVSVVCLTCGEKGQNFSGVKDQSLAGIRSGEFGQAVEALGVKEAYLWNYCDGNLSVDVSWKETLKQHVDDWKPGLIVSYDEFGVTGHPDHRVVAETILEWYRQQKMWKLIWPKHERFLGWMMVKRTGMRGSGVGWRLKLRWREMVGKWLAIVAHRSQWLHRWWWKEVGIWLKIYLEEVYVQAI